MPSRRSSASTSPRSVHAAAARTMRSFSDAEKDLLLPPFGTVSTETPPGRGAAPGAAGPERAEGGEALAAETPLGRPAAPCAPVAGRSEGGGSRTTATPLGQGEALCAAGAGIDLTDRRWEGLGTVQVHSPPSLQRLREEAVSGDVETGGVVGAGVDVGGDGGDVGE